VIHRRFAFAPFERATGRTMVDKALFLEGA
jgi:hypothetical protein